jgi:hypothetical protein
MLRSQKIPMIRSSRNVSLTGQMNRVPFLDIPAGELPAQASAAGDRTWKEPSACAPIPPAVSFLDMPPP